MASLSSRLIVKNLPKSITETKIRSVFSAKGTVTDVQLKYTQEGLFRGFAFIGFKTPEEANGALNYFNKTFIGTSKIQVEICSELGDPSKPRAWSKHAPEHQDSENKLKRKQEEVEDESKEKKKKKKKKEEEILEKCKTDPDFLEFLESHKQNSTWGNDEIIADLEKQVIKESENETTEKHIKKSKKKIKSNEEVDDKNDQPKINKKVKPIISSKIEPIKNKKCFFTIKLLEVPTKAKKKDIKSFFAPLVPRSIRIPPKIRGIAYAGFRTEEEQTQALHKHKSFLFGNKIYLKILNLPNLSDYEASKRQKTVNSEWATLQTELETNSEPVGESGKIFIRNLSYLTNEDEIQKLFEEYGTVTEVNLPLDKLTRRIKGFGFVSFMLPEHAMKAFSNLDGTVFQGRMLHLLPYKSIVEPVESKTGGTSYKHTKTIKQKKTASSSHNWNTLFLGQNAVAEVAADKYGLSKEELLLDKSDERDRNQPSIGVRMALAEAEIVDETKNFMETNGVSLAAFENFKTERSKTCMLVKNLEGKTSANDLMELFNKHGEIGRIVLPKSGITAIVEFLEPAEARAAFKKLAYTKFHGLPLYLEWAPLDTFLIGGKSVPSTSSLTPSNPIDQQNNNLKLKSQDTETQQKLNDDIPEKTVEITSDGIDEDMVPELDTTLFVKNLNFDTNEAALKKHFSQVGPIFNATVATKRDSKHPGQTLSMGYGFIQFYRTNDVNSALKNLQGSMLQNHVLELKRSNRTLQSDTAVQRKVAGIEDNSGGTKLLVRNVPFQTSKQELMDLFKTFGELRACRLPMKLDGSGEHRGFAFIEYFAEHEAKRALETLAKSTHLYGRRLVIEWAAKSETVEELRQRTAKQFNRLTSGHDDTKPSMKRMMTRYFSKQPKKKSDDEDDDG